MGLSCRPVPERVSSRRRVILVALAVVVVASAAVLAFRPSGDQPTVTGAAPAFSTVDLTGRAVRLADYRGRAVLLNFWASWCVPCRKEFPLLKGVEGKGVEVLGVVFQDTADAAAAFMKEQQATWPGLQDPGGRIAHDYDVGFRPGLPVTVLVDRQGRVAERHVGELRQEDLDHLLALASGRLSSK